MNLLRRIIGVKYIREEDSFSKSRKLRIIFIYLTGMLNLVVVGLENQKGFFTMYNKSEKTKKHMRFATEVEILRYSTKGKNY